MQPMVAKIPFDLSHTVKYGLARIAVLALPMSFHLWPDPASIVCSIEVLRYIRMQLCQCSRIRKQNVALLDRQQRLLHAGVHTQNAGVHT